MGDDIVNGYINNQNSDDVFCLLNKALKIGLDFKLKDEVVNYHSYNDLFSMLDEPLPIFGKSLDLLLDEVSEKVVKNSTNFSSPYAMAFPDAGNSTAAVSGAIIADLINQNLINWSHCSPAATIVEVLVLRWLRELVGYSAPNEANTPLEVGGIISTGGVSSNTISQLIARERAFPGAMKKGVAKLSQEAVSIVPGGIDHYGSRLATGWIGLGEDQVIKAPVKNFKYDLIELEKLMGKVTSEGKRIFSLIAYAGDSRSMTCDNFVELRKLCDKHDVWFHVDGCHGTQLLFSKKLREKLRGIELADSITFDPHKVMNIPYVMSVILLKNPEDLRLIQRPEDIITGEEHSFGQVTPFFGSRAFLSLKFYMLLKHLGVSGLAQTIEKRHEDAVMLAKKINDNKNFKLINPVIDINSVVFMYCPEKVWQHGDDNGKSIAIINKLNTLIQDYLYKSGRLWLHNFMIPDFSNVFGLGEKTLLRPLRYMSGNPVVKEYHLDQMIKKVEEAGERILKDLVF